MRSLKWILTLITLALLAIFPPRVYFKYGGVSNGDILSHCTYTSISWHSRNYSYYYEITIWLDHQEDK